MYYLFGKNGMNRQGHVCFTDNENGTKKSQGQLLHDWKENPPPITLSNQRIIAGRHYL